MHLLPPHAIALLICRFDIYRRQEVGAPLRHSFWFLTEYMVHLGWQISVINRGVKMEEGGIVIYLGVLIHYAILI